MGIVIKILVTITIMAKPNDCSKWNLAKDDLAPFR